MAVEDDDDRLALLADFGQVALLAPKATPANITTITGIFDNKFIEAGGFGIERPLESREPVINCRTSDVSTFVRGDLLETGGINYTMETFEQDGTGFTNIILQVV